MCHTYQATKLQQVRFATRIWHAHVQRTVLHAVCWQSGLPGERRRGIDWLDHYDCVAPACTRGQCGYIHCAMLRERSHLAQACSSIQTCYQVCPPLRPLTPLKSPSHLFANNLLPALGTMQALAAANRKPNRKASCTLTPSL